MNEKNEFKPFVPASKTLQEFTLFLEWFWQLFLAEQMHTWAFVWV